MRSYLASYKASALLPPHRVVRPEQVRELAHDIRKRGWSGPPLVGYHVGGRKPVQLLSGTHRRAACELIGVAVPVRVYEHTFVTRCWGRLARWTALMRGEL